MFNATGAHYVAQRPKATLVKNRFLCKKILFSLTFASMNKSFNVSGLCFPEDHYMVDPFRGIYKSIYRLIENKHFFLLHAPRQMGKTTLLHALTRRLNHEGKYIALVVSVETAGVPSFTEAMANERMVNAVHSIAPLFLPENERPAKPQHPISLKDYLVAWAESQSKPIVLLLDEADSLWDDVMVSFLRQLRDGFQQRPKRFPQSVALVGLRDIREYRLKARADNPSMGSGSPFNVKTKSFLLPFFSKKEVDSLLQQHTDATGQVFPKKVRDLIFYYSGGQPWLTNALANQIVAYILDDDYSKKITPKMVETAKENLIAERQTHLDSLADKVNDPGIKQVVMGIISGAKPAFDDWDNAVRYARDLGIIKKTSPIEFASPIYREIITRILNSGFHDSFNNDIVQTAWYLRRDGTLDVDKLLHAFLDFYQWNSESWLDRFQYREAGHQLLLMAFLQRIINGGGRIDREMAVGNGRTDLAIFWKNQVIAIELKIRQNMRTEQEGLEQLDRYLDRLGQKSGYLVIFDQRPPNEYTWEARISWAIREYNDKTITMITM